MWPWKNPPSLPPDHWVVTSIWRYFSGGNLSSKSQCPILMSPIKYSSPGEPVSTFIALTAHCTSVTHAASQTLCREQAFHCTAFRKKDKVIQPRLYIRSVAWLCLICCCSLCSVPPWMFSFFQSSGKRNKAIDACWEGDAVNFFLPFVPLPNNQCLF